MNVMGIRQVVLTCLMVALSAGQCFGAGFGIYEWSARGNALGGATVGRADDPSTIASNPAGITQLEGTQVLGGLTAIHPTMDVTVGSKTESNENSFESSWWIPGHFYLTHELNDHYWFGIGEFTRFGLGSVFDENWEGRYNSYEAIIRAASINPNIGIKFNDKFSMAFGLEAMYMNFDKSQKIKTPAGDVDFGVSGDDIGYGFNIAAHYKPCKYARIGLTYRSKVDMTIEGDAKFDNVSPLLPAVNKAVLTDGGVKGDITLPDMWLAGIAIYPTDKLSVEVGTVYTHWSTYDEMDMDFDNVATEKSSLGQAQPKNWKDTWRFNVGVEYAAMDWLDLRLGYVYDESPVRDSTIDYMVPANDRHIFGAGTGFKWDSWTLDLAYNYLMILDRDISAHGSVQDGDIDNGQAHMFSMSVGYKF